MPTITPAELQQLTTRIFTAMDAPEADAEEVAKHLVASNLAGHDSHGVIRIPRYAQQIRDGMILPGREITVERETVNTAVVNGHHDFGQVTARKVAELALAKARQANIGMITAYECNHVGRLGAYPEIIAAAGYLGMAVVNNNGGGRLMSAFGGVEPRTSPNPISMAVPTGRPDRPFLVDMTASVVAEGKLLLKRNRGEPVPDGWATTATGKPAHTADEFYGPPRGAILPTGGSVAHKGFALALMVEVLGGALSRAQCSNPEAPLTSGNGLWMMAVNIEAFTPMDEFQQKVGGLTDYVKSPPYAPGFDEILVPGEPEYRSALQRMDGIFLDDETWRQIQDVADGVGVTV